MRSLLTDGMTVLHEIDYTAAHLRRWMRAPAARTHCSWPARAEVRYQPVGVVGIIAPWNYPVNLALMPLVAALAAGNHVMLKPSELTPRTRRTAGGLLAEVFPRGSRGRGAGRRRGRGASSRRCRSTICSSPVRPRSGAR